MEREVGGGIGMGKTCKLKDVSFQCMTKFTTKKKKKTVKKKNTLYHTLYSLSNGLQHLCNPFNDLGK